MKIIVFRIRRLLAVAVAAAAATACAGLLFQPKIKAVFASPSGRSLPIYSVQTDENKVALGINCAWDEKDIQPMLKTLGEHNTKATFFLLGQWTKKYPEAAKAIAYADQEIGSHSNSHRDMDDLTQEQILEEITLSQAQIKEACGKIPLLFRPPSGAYNDLVIDTIHQSGCTPIQWSIDTLDWKGLSAQEIAERVKKKLSPGAVILLHAGAEHSAEALPLILDAAESMGFSVVPVGELIYPDSSSIDNNGTQQKPKSASSYNNKN